MTPCGVGGRSRNPSATRIKGHKVSFGIYGGWWIWLSGNVRTSKGHTYVNNKKGSPQGRGLIMLLFQIVVAKSNSTQLHALDALLQDGLVAL